MRSRTYWSFTRNVKEMGTGQNSTSRLVVAKNSSPSQVCPAAGSTADAEAGVEEGGRLKTKKPSQLRRDRLRREEFKEKRLQAAEHVVMEEVVVKEEVKESSEDVKEIEDEVKEIKEDLKELSDISRTGETSLTETSSEAGQNITDDTTDFEQGQICEKQESNDKNKKQENTWSQEDFDIFKKLLEESFSKLPRRSDILLLGQPKTKEEEYDMKTEEENEHLEDAMLWAVKQKSSLGLNK